MSHDEAGLRLMLRKVGDDYVLIAVNERDAGLAFQVRRLPADLEDKTLFRLGSDEAIIVRQAGFRDGIEPYGVYVYATSRRFEAGSRK